jgi:hypothetical protein
MRRLILLMACLGGVVGCSSDSDNNNTVDAAIDAPGSSGACLVSNNYGDLGAKTGNTSLGGTSLSIEIDAGPPRDNLLIKLNAGKGVFSGGLKPGTYSLASETDFTNCGLCVNIVADIVSMQGPTKFYFADAGMVTLTSVMPPEGSAQNITFHEVNAGGTTIPGCTSAIGAISFSEM